MSAFDERKFVMLKPIVFVTALAIVAGALLPPVHASRRLGPVRIWVQIVAQPGETRWETCRRVFQQDVHRVRRGDEGTVWCWVIHSRVHGYDVNRNFNRY